VHNNIINHDVNTNIVANVQLIFQYGLSWRTIWRWSMGNSIQRELKKGSSCTPTYSSFQALILGSAQLFVICT